MRNITTCLSLTICLLVALASPLRAQNKTTDLYDTETVQQIRLTLDVDNWREVLDSMRLNDDGYLLADATINGQKFDNIGVRYRGNKSYTLGGKRNPLNIKLNYINKSQAYGDYKTIKLTTALRDPSMVREVLSFEIARDYMPAPRANYAQVYVNNEYYGLLVNVQPIDEQFLEENFGESDGYLFKTRENALDQTPRGCRRGVYGSLQYEGKLKCYLNNWEEIGNDGWDELIELTRILEEEPKRIDEVLHVDNTLWMLAFNNVLLNLNSYSGNHSQNFYLYRDVSGRFNPIIWDMNLSFGSYKNVGGGSDLNIKQLQQIDPLLHVDNESKPLIRQLMSNDKYRKMYFSHVRQIVYDHFKDGQYLTRARELQRSIQTAFSSDPSKEYSLSDMQGNLTQTHGKKSRIPGLEELMQARTENLRRDKSIAVVPSTIESVELRRRRELSNERIDAFTVRAKVGKFPKLVLLHYRFSPDAAFQTMQMHDDGQHRDIRSGDEIFAATAVPLNGEQEMEYYISVENAAIMSYSPANYTQDRMTANLGELNK